MTPSRFHPARKLAGLLIGRLDLTPPIPIHQMAQDYADLELADWPTEGVDAVMLRRSGERPQIFYRPNPQNFGRERFTIAHELGHVLIPWHVGNSACSPQHHDYDLYQASEEDQADIFASCLLVPDRWLSDLVAVHRDDMTSLLAAVEIANISATAILMAIRRVLLPGFAFQLNQQATAFVSLGTGIYGGSFRDSSELRKAFDGLAHTSGRLGLAGHKVRWWQVSLRTVIPAEDQDSRTDTELIRAAIANINPDANRAASMLASVNGKVGGGANELAGRPAADIYQSLWHRFSIDGRYVALIEQSEFAAWLARKARTRGAAG